MATIINYRLLLRGGPDSEWNEYDPVLMSREPGINTSTGGLKLGDGITPWSGLEYVWGGEDYNLTIGTVTTSLDGSSSASLSGTAPNQFLNLTLARGPQGETGATGATGEPGPAPNIGVGTVTTGLPGTNAAVSITGTSPNYTLSFTIPRGATGATGATGETGATGPQGPQGETGATGPANTLSIGTVETTAAGTTATATITGTAPNQTLSLTVPKGDTGEAGATGATGPEGPAGPANTLTIGTVTTGETGDPALVTISGTSPNQTLDFTLPRGPQGETGAPGPVGPEGPVGPQGPEGHGLDVDGSVGTYADLPTTGLTAGDVYFVEDTALIYVWSGTAWGNGHELQGATGPAGPANVLSIGTVTTGDPGTAAAATITGTSPEQVLSFTIPRGATGDTGPANTLSIGTVTTVAAGGAATAAITGTAPNQILDLGIPTGATGDPGPTGATGDPGPANTLAIGTVSTVTPGGAATASITGTSPNQTLSLGIPAGETGATGATGAPGPANNLSIGTVTTGLPGDPAAASVTGTSPDQTLNLTLPKGDTGPTGATGATGDPGPANTLAIGTVTTGAAGTTASADITGSSPNQTLNLTIPRGDTGATGATGDPGPANTLAIGTVSNVAPGGAATASITGTSPNQTLNLGIPEGLTGPANSLSIGTVTSLPTGDAATATITGTPPNQVLDLGLPTGEGVPAGGTTGQALTKTSATDYATQWTTLDYAASSHTHAAGDITTGTLAAARLPAATTTTQGAMSAADKTKLDGAASTATTSALVLRDAAGRAQFSDPSVDADAATMGWVNTGLGGKSNTGHTHLWADITDKPTTFTPSAHTHLWADLTDKPSTFTPSAHTHAAGDVTSGTLAAARLPAATTTTQGAMSAADKAKLDSTTTSANANTLPIRDAGGRFNVQDPTIDAHPTSRGWVNTQLAGKAASTHTHAQSDITNLTTDLAGKAPSAAGVPTGGTAGQHLVKTSGTNYAMAWTTTEWYGSQASYDAIATKDGSVTYFITA